MAAVAARAGRGRGAAWARARSHDIDWYVARRVRERRVGCGLSLQQLAERIGTSSQQARKYEAGVSRIAAGRLFLVARALEVEVGYFFEDLGAEGEPPPWPHRRRLLLELARHFGRLRSVEQQAALCAVARALAPLDPPMTRA